MPRKGLKKKRKIRQKAPEGRIYLAILRGFRTAILRANPSYKVFIRRRIYFSEYREVLEVHSPRHHGPATVMLSPDGGTISAWRSEFPLADPDVEELVLKAIDDCFDQPRGALWGRDGNVRV